MNLILVPALGHDRVQALSDGGQRDERSTCLPVPLLLGKFVPVPGGSRMSRLLGAQANECRIVPQRRDH